MKLIDKDILVAEIDNCVDRCNIKKRSCPVNTQVEAICDNKIHAYKELLFFLNALETKEVDIEKEVMDWWNAHYSSKNYTFEKYTGHYLENTTLIEIAKHFYELGLKTKKGES